MNKKFVLVLLTISFTFNLYFLLFEREKATDLPETFISETSVPVTSESSLNTLASVDHSSGYSRHSLDGEVIELEIVDDPIKIVEKNTNQDTAADNEGRDSVHAEILVDDVAAREEAMAQVDSYVTSALSTGVWSDIENQEIIKYSHLISDKQRRDLVTRITEAISNGELEVTGQWPML